MRKILIVLLTVVVFTTGCSITRTDNKDIGQILDIYLKDKHSLTNTVFDGYSYYLPRGLKILDKDEYNTLFTDENNYRYYMYVDVVSFYNKVEYEYEVNKSSYYSKRLKYNKKEGYIEINKNDDKYFVEVMFNYAKIEVYIDKKDMNDVITNIASVLSTLKYNRKVLSTIIGENALNYKEETFNIFETKNKKNTNFLDYVKEYDKVDDEEIDEDNVEIVEE